MVKRLQPPNDQQPNGASESYDEYVGTGADNEMAFEIQDVVDLAVSNVMTDKAQAKPQNGKLNCYEARMFVCSLYFRRFIRIQDRHGYLRKCGIS